MVSGRGSLCAIGEFMVERGCIGIACESRHGDENCGVAIGSGGLQCYESAPRGDAADFLNGDVDGRRDKYCGRNCVGCACFTVGRIGRLRLLERVI